MDAISTTRLKGEITRLDILDCLASRDQANITILTDATGKSAPAVRAHLRRLVEMGVVERSQFAGPGTVYRLLDEP